MAECPGQLVRSGNLSILPRSLHLPVAVVDGNLIKNFSEIGVRLWTVAT
jgi:hypothetical protein